MSALAGTAQTELDTYDCWSEDGDELFVSKRVMTRGQARAYYSNETGVPFTEIRVRTVWMKMEEQKDPKWTDWEGDNPWPYSSEYDVWCAIVAPAEADFEYWRVSA